MQNHNIELELIVWDEDIIVLFMDLVKKVYGFE